MVVRRCSSGSKEVQRWQQGGAMARGAVGSDYGSKGISDKGGGSGVMRSTQSHGPTVGSGDRDGRGGRLPQQGKKKGVADEGGEEEGVIMTGEGTVEEEVVAAMRATVGEVGCDREGRKVRMRM
ncbi:hypothetical protein B296_00018604 [Ensete ventricosum]|uniref:DUF834 domain-containing protein n=1 Tax=Ensete ventricosum TaxID=4639 RepID=A0A427ATK7_ENSVE|nr:hypothetical protein B296_00018604 [Ensete ventricosum]